MSCQFINSHLALNLILKAIRTPSYFFLWFTCYAQLLFSSSSNFSDRTYIDIVFVSFDIKIFPYIADNVILDVFLVPKHIFLQFGIYVQLLFLSSSFSNFLDTSSKSRDMNEI